MSLLCMVGLFIAHSLNCELGRCIDDETMARMVMVLVGVIIFFISEIWKLKTKKTTKGTETSNPNSIIFLHAILIYSHSYVYQWAIGYVCRMPYAHLPSLPAILHRTKRTRMCLTMIVQYDGWYPAIHIVHSTHRSHNFQTLEKCFKQLKWLATTATAKSSSFLVALYSESQPFYTITTLRNVNFGE